MDDTRLRRLEVHCRLLQLGLLAAVALIALSAWTQGNQKTLKVERLEVVTPKGKVIAVLGQTPENMGTLVIRGTGVEDAIRIGATADGSVMRLAHGDYSSEITASATSSGISTGANDKAKCLMLSAKNLERAIIRLTDNDGKTVFRAP